MSTPSLDLGRRLPTREPKKSLLVVHRGGIEGHYLHYLKRRLDHGQLSMVGIADDLAGEEARRSATVLARKARAQGSAYDEVWCEIAALEKVDSSNARGPLINLFSCVPCFEKWLLMHFETVDHSQDRNGVKAALNVYLPDLDSAPRASLELLNGRYASARAQSVSAPRSDNVHHVHSLVDSIIDSLRNFRRDPDEPVDL